MTPQMEKKYGQIYDVLLTSVRCNYLLSQDGAQLMSGTRSILTHFRIRHVGCMLISMWESVTGTDLNANMSGFGHKLGCNFFSPHTQRLSVIHTFTEHPGEERCPARLSILTAAINQTAFTDSPPGKQLIGKEKGARPKRANAIIDWV